MFGLKIVGTIGISTCLCKILYNMIPLLQVFLRRNVVQERFFKRLVTYLKTAFLENRILLNFDL